MLSQKHLCAFVKFSPIIPPVSAHLMKMWVRKHFGDSLSCQIRWLCWFNPEASPLFSTSTEKVLINSFINPVCRYYNFHLTKFNFTKSEDSKNSSYSTTLLDERLTFTPVCNSTVWRGKASFLKLPIWHLRVLLDVENSLVCIDWRGKRQEGSFFIFLFLENVADPVSCTQEPSKLLV